MSDDGSDNNHCNLESTPCRNLQTVLNRATVNADIYVTSSTLSLDGVHSNNEWQAVKCCLAKSSLSFTINSLNGPTVNLTCSGSLSRSNIDILLVVCYSHLSGGFWLFAP